jgi:hypothetical protein
MIIYYIDGKKFTTKYNDSITLSQISSPDENTPAWENLLTGTKFWCEKGCILHRLTGPANIHANGDEDYWLNGKQYENIHD